MPDKIFFVTGIDTNVGKTLVSLLLLISFKKRGLDAGYMKPVETGVKIGENGATKIIKSRVNINGICYQGKSWELH